MKQGEYHTVVEIWTINSKGEILVTLRDPSKRDYPNKWENTGGSILCGESSRQGAIRELFEETGIVAREDELILLGTDRGSSAFYDIYLLKQDIEIGQLTMQADETIAAQWVTLAVLDGMIIDLSLALPVGQRLKSVRKEFEEYYSHSSI